MDLQKLPRLDFQIGIHERRGHVFGEDVERQHAAMLQVAQHLMPPDEDFAGGRGFEELLFADRLAVGGGKQLAIAQKHSQRQMAAGDVAEVAFDLMRS